MKDSLQATIAVDMVDQYNIDLSFVMCYSFQTKDGCGFEYFPRKTVHHAHFDKRETSRAHPLRCAHRRCYVATGTVKFFNAQKGFGFICPDGGGEDLFIHRSNIDTPDQTLQDNQQVEFEIGEGRKGPEATNARPL